MLLIDHIHSSGIRDIDKRSQDKNNKNHTTTKISPQREDYLKAHVPSNAMVKHDARNKEIRVSIVHDCVFLSLSCASLNNHS